MDELIRFNSAQLAQIKCILRDAFLRVFQQFNLIPSSIESSVDSSSVESFKSSVNPMTTSCPRAAIRSLFQAKNVPTAAATVRPALYSCAVVFPFDPGGLNHTTPTSIRDY